MQKQEIVDERLAQTVHHIRPFKLFAAFEAEGPERVALIRLSKRRGLEMGVMDETPRPGVADYSLTYLETAVLVAVLGITDARRAFEFGTHLGATTLNIALNLPPAGLVYTIDLMGRERFKEWRGFPEADKIYAICGQDSTFYNFDDLIDLGRFEFIWIDGNPDRWTDTLNAFELLNPSRLSCIGWHDYGAEGANTTEVVDALAREGKTIYHIEETKVCLWFNRPVKGLA